MRLNLYAVSKNKIGYTPDSLTIETPDCEYHYDIQGDISYDFEILDCSCKGNLFVYNESENDYLPLSKEDEKILKALLKRKDVQFRVSIYPIDDEVTKLFVKHDTLTECEGSISINLDGEEITRDFTFLTESVY